MGEEKFQSEVLQRLTRIETNQENMSDHKSKLDSLEIQVARVETSTESAHHRLDAMLTDRLELKKDLTGVIKEQISGIYRTAGIIGGGISFFIGIIMVLMFH